LRASLNHMQEREEIRQLFERYREGRCTSEEEARLHAWVTEYTRHEASGLDELRAAYKAEHTSDRKQWMRWLPYAAAFAIALTATWYFWSGSDANRPADNLVMQSEDIAPGRNRATLTLADGHKIDLSEAQAGIVVGDEFILYEEGAEELVNLEADKAIQLVLSTPKGGTYQITLSDGTKVWLNSASTLKYPSRFNEKERIVEISGEGYFEVAKDKLKPFKVISSGQEIEVLGTEFNVSAYEDDNEVKTTLIEGSVHITSLETDTQEERIGGKLADRNGITLAPGEQGLLTKKGISKRIVDPTAAIAWKDGHFYFDNTPLSDMMKQIARWYHVEVIYEHRIPQELFSGEMSRNVTLQTVLELLKISEINYRIEGNLLIIE